MTHAERCRFAYGPFAAWIAFGMWALIVFVAVEPSLAQNLTSNFTVFDDIALNRIEGSAVFSPNGRWFFIVSERGRSDIDRSESSIRIYDAETVSSFLLTRKMQCVPPAWVIRRANFAEGPVVTDVRWLGNSTGVVFLAKTFNGNNQLFLATVEARTIVPLTPPSQHVTGFDVRNTRRFAYTALSPLIRRQSVAQKRALQVVATGKSLASLLFAEERWNSPESPYDLSELWVVREGKRFRVQDARTGHAIAIHQEGQRALALSPDGHTAVTVLSVGIVPHNWEALYPPPSIASPYRVRAGAQDTDALSGQSQISQYVMVDLDTGTVTSLTNAPIGNTAGWVGVSSADWSADGRSLVLSNTFIDPQKQDSENQILRPCVAVQELSTGRATCINSTESNIDATELEKWWVYEAQFDSTTGHSVKVRYSGRGLVTYKRSKDGSWAVGSSSMSPISENSTIQVLIKQDLNSPPLLTATDKKSGESRVIWDPDPQLTRSRMGEVRVFRWHDRIGRDWVGGLYLPPNYVADKRYPLVIQTHGFEFHRFLPSGAFTTAFAAEELAASGLIVLQIEDCGARDTPEEGPCQVLGYEAAVEQLSAMNMIDPEKVGIIGFSRTCYYVLQALTSSRLKFQAASITDGVNEGYLQYVTGIDLNGNALPREYDAMIGTAPFGPGLLSWLRQSPDFNMDKVHTPLQVVALGRRSLLFMWEPYAALRFLKRPVDLILINSDEHILTNPGSRAVSQGGTVDWFRFWLQGYEDPDPSKLAQYVRWRAMRERHDETGISANSQIGGTRIIP